MGTINDFKIVAGKSQNYFELLDIEREIPDIEKQRLGFYLFILESVTNIKDIDLVIDMVIDTEFLSIVYDEKNNDLGIDAVYIDEESKKIQLFNFKYREKFNPTRGQTESNVLDSIKFLSSIGDTQYDDAYERTYQKLKSISDKYKTTERWSTELYLVSNDNVSLEIEDNIVVRQLKDKFDITVKSIVLDDIMDFLSDRPDDITATLVIDKDFVMTYEEDTMSSSKSYLVKMNILDLIRVTSTSEEMRNNTELSDENIINLKEQKLEIGLLFDNVRGYLGETKYNRNIFKTLEEEPSKFFMYNNGITITAKRLIVDPINIKSKYQLKMEGFQIVNGGQTLRTIYAYIKNNFNAEKLKAAEILVRIFQTEENEELTNNIAEYTNSQNAISSSDLKSISNFQIKIEAYLETQGVKYVRKSGDVGDSDLDYTVRVSMEKVAQILYSDMGFPDRATNQKSQLFDRYYDEIFNPTELKFERIVKLIELYEEIRLSFEEEENGFHQKFLYIIFLKKELPTFEITELIDLLQTSLTEYKENEEDLSEARKLIQKDFKIYLERKINNIKSMAD